MELYERPNKTSMKKSQKLKNWQHRDIMRRKHFKKIRRSKTNSLILFAAGVTGLFLDHYECIPQKEPF
jgi:hypothetical protein